MKCSTCDSEMRLLPGGGGYCPSDECPDAGDFDDAPTKVREPLATLVLTNGTCAACGSSEIEPFPVNGVARVHCWGCGRVSAREAVHS